MNSQLLNLKSGVIGSDGTWSERPDDYNEHLSTVKLSDVTKIEVYKQINYGGIPIFGWHHVVCIVFYSG